MCTRTNIFTTFVIIMKKVTIKDIATLAGVSRGTVDRALNNRGNIDPEKKKLILSIAKKLGYEKNLIASTLAHNKEIKIAVVLPDPDRDPFWKLPLTGIEKSQRFIKHYGLSTQFYYFNIFDKNDYSRILVKALTKQPDAILTAPVYREESVAFLQTAVQNKIPVFTINTEINHEDTLCYIGQNSFQCGLLAGRLINSNKKGKLKILALTLGHESKNAAHIAEKIRGLQSYSDQNNLANTIIDAAIENFSDPQTLYQESIKLLASNKDLEGILFTNSRAYHFINQIDFNSNLLKPATIVGFDLIPQNIDLLINGKIDFLINQDPVKQGYLGMINILNHLVFRKEIQFKQYLPADIVVKENYELYINEMETDLEMAI